MDESMQIDMKGHFVILFFNLFILSMVHAQSTSEDQRAINMLRSFYVSYDSAWVCIENPESLRDRLLYLQQNYCSASLQRVVNGYYTTRGLNHDLFLDDTLTDLKTFVSTLTVIKDTTRANSYIVSFSSNVNDPGDTGQRQIALRVGMVNENNHLKINRVDVYFNRHKQDPGLLNSGI